MIRNNKKLKIFLAIFVVALSFSLYIIPPTFGRFLSTKTLSPTLKISKPIFTIILDEQSPTVQGTTSIFEKYSIGFYLDQSLTNQMTTTTNGITIPEKDGYTFQGYYTQTNGGGTQYIDENGKLTSNANSVNFTTDDTLYAHWMQNIIEGNPEKGDTVIYYPVASSEDSPAAWFSDGVLGYSSNNSSYYVSADYLGVTPVNSVFTQESLGWKIWDINENKVRLVSDTSTTQRLTIQKAVGFNNGLFFLNDICNKLYAGDVDGITAKNLTQKDIEEKMILHYASENPNATGYVDSDGNPIWSDNNIKNITNTSGYGTESTLAKGTIRYIPMVLSNDISNRTTISQSINISLSSIGLDDDYSTATVAVPPMTSTYWTGRDYTTGGTKRPITAKETFYQLSTNMSNYFDTIDYDMIFNKDSYWLSSKSVHYVSSNFRFFIRLISYDNKITQYIMDSTSDKSGTLGSTLGDDGYSLRLRPIVTIDRSKYNLVKNSDDTYSIVAK